MGIKAGNLPISTIDSTDYLLITEGEAPKRVLYSDVKSDIIGTETLTTTSQTVKGAINEVKGLTDSNTTSLSDLANHFNANLAGATDANILLTAGRYFTNGCANIPLTVGGTYALIDVVANSDKLYVKQTLTYVHGNTSYIGKTYVRYYDNGTWSNWVELARVISPTEIAITGLNGFASAFGNKAVYMKTQENIVKINCYLKTTTAITGGITLFNLPLGYRTNEVFRAVGLVGTTSTNMNRPCLIRIDTNGDVIIDATDGLSYAYIAFNADFVGV